MGQIICSWYATSEFIHIGPDNNSKLCFLFLKALFVFAG